jgi:2-methylcitrate dehydratase PrpD
MGALAEIARFVCHAPASALEPAQRAQLRRHVADAAIALIAGARSPEGATLLALSSNGDWTEGAAAAAGVIRSTEVDDIHLASCTTPTSVVMPAALLTTPDLTPDRVEDAIHVGIEVMVRLGLAINGPAVLYKGVWPTCFATPFSVAATVARLWALDEATTVQALSLALML